MDDDTGVEGITVTRLGLGGSRPPHTVRRVFTTGRHQDHPSDDGTVRALTSPRERKYLSAQREREARALPGRAATAPAEGEARGGRGAATAPTVREAPPALYTPRPC